MPHDHDHNVNDFGRAFAIGIALNVIFVAVEVIYGLRASSTALLADAGHNLSDVLSLAFAWIATVLAKRHPFGRYTYGLRRTTILVSILNALILFGAIGGILYEVINHLQHAVPVAGKVMMIVALIGVGINTATALLFIKGQNDLNIKSAYLHMAADALVSLGVVIAGVIIMYTGLFWIDPVITFIIVIVILYGTWNLFSDSLNLALDAVPKNIDIDEVRDFLKSIGGVEDVHDLHIWAMSTTETALTVHLVVPEGAEDKFIFSVREQLKNKFNICHTTIQIENTFEDEMYRPDCR